MQNRASCTTRLARSRSPIIYKREKTFQKGIREKAHKQDTSQTQQPHFTIVTSAPTSPFQHKSHSTTTSHIHIHASLPTTPNRKVTILTPTKSQSKILYACTNEKYLIPISVPILPHTTPQDRIIPHITSCVDSGRCDGVIL